MTSFSGVPPSHWKLPLYGPCEMRTVCEISDMSRPPRPRPRPRPMPPPPPLGAPRPPAPPPAVGTKTILLPKISSLFAADNLTYRKDTSRSAQINTRFWKKSGYWVAVPVWIVGLFAPCSECFVCALEYTQLLAVCNGKGRCCYRLVSLTTCDTAVQGSKEQWTPPNSFTCNTLHSEFNPVGDRSFFYWGGGGGLMGFGGVSFVNCVIPQLTSFNHITLPQKEGFFWMTPTLSPK